jgi:hypothetical protein
MLYFDTAVGELARQAEVHSSAISIAEMACLAHRKVREGLIGPADPRFACEVLRLLLAAFRHPAI